MASSTIVKVAVVASALLGSAVLPGRAVAAEPFTLTSPDVTERFGDAQLLSQPYGFGCSGGNQSPRLAWSHAPAGTKSYVLMLRDLDAPTGMGWTHWVVANIPGSATELPGGIPATGDKLPSGALQTRTDFGVPGYGGPCPPQGARHAYVLTLIALKVDRLPDAVTAEATPALVGFFAKANALGEATLTVRQGR